MAKERWPTNKDLARELLDIGATEAERGSTSHKKFKLGPYSIVIPWQHPGRDATPTVVRSVRRFIREHGPK